MQDNIKNVVVTMTFIVVLLMFLLINIVKKDDEISISERRKLTQFPEISIKNVLDGSFMNSFDNYSMDQFFKRDEFKKIKNLIELQIFRKKDINNINLYNGHMIGKNYPLNDKAVNSTINKINNIKNTFLNSSNNIYFSIIPDKSYFLDDTYLKIDFLRVEKEMQEKLDNIEYIDIMNLLKLEDYYYTDTHWKQEKIEKVASKISDQMGFKDRIKTEFKQKEICFFDGVYAGDLQIDSNKDKIIILTNEILENCITYNVESNENNNIYDLDKVDDIDKYNIYLSGATPIITIENNNSALGKELIIFRDSFGSSIAPLFAEAYDKIILIDTRYIAPQLLSDYVDFENKDVLFIYSTLVINSIALK